MLKDFEDIKGLLINTLVITLTTANDKFWLESDISKMDAGVILFQFQQDNGHLFVTIEKITESSPDLQ